MKKYIVTSIYRKLLNKQSFVLQNVQSFVNFKFQNFVQVLYQTVCHSSNKQNKKRKKKRITTFHCQTSTLSHGDCIAVHFKWTAMPIQALAHRTSFCLDLYSHPVHVFKYISRQRIHIRYHFDGVSPYLPLEHSLIAGFSIHTN